MAATQPNAGEAQPSAAPSARFGEERLLQMYYKMLLSRKLDERIWILNRQGRAAFHISAMGHEAVQVGAAFALRPGHDWVLPYYRDLALVLALGMTPRDILLGALSKAEDPSSGGRQMPSHYGYRPLNIVSVSSPVATQIPQAVGVALAARYRGEDTVTLTSFGEGSTSGGDFHEGLNWASLDRLPVVFLCQNNQYALSEPIQKQMAVANVADRAAAYAMPGIIVDGNDVLAVYDAVFAAVERARRGEGPTLLEAKTYRLVPHSSDDDDRSYRRREEVDSWKVRDPILRSERFLMERGLLDINSQQEYLNRAVAEVNEAVEYAQAAPYAAPEDALAPVFAGRSEKDGDENKH